MCHDVAIDHYNFAVNRRPVKYEPCGCRLDMKHRCTAPMDIDTIHALGKTYHVDYTQCLVTAPHSGGPNLSLQGR